MENLVINSKNDLQLLSENRKTLGPCKAVVVFFDNKSSQPLHYLVSNHPVDALRSVPSFLKEMRLPKEDLDVIYFGDIFEDDLSFKPTSETLKHQFKLELSCYFEVENSDNSDKSN